MDNTLFRLLDQVHAEADWKARTAYRLRAAAAQKRRPVRQRLAATCAALALALSLSGLSYYFYAVPAAYVDVDATPAVELTLNRAGHVMRATAYNPEGAALLDTLSVTGMHYDRAVEAIAAAHHPGDESMTVTVQGGTADMLRALGDAAGSASVVYPVTAEVKADARVHHMTPAKYLAVTELQALDPTVTFAGCHGYSTGEIVRMIAAHGGGHGAGSGQVGGETPDHMEETPDHMEDKGNAHMGTDDGDHMGIDNSEHNTGNAGNGHGNGHGGGHR